MHGIEVPLIKVENTAAGWRREHEGNWDLEVSFVGPWTPRRVPALPCKVLQHLPPPWGTFQASFPCLTLPVTQLQLYKPPCWSSNIPGRLLPQDHCIHCSFCLKHLSPRSPQSWLPDLLSALFTCQVSGLPWPSYLKFHLKKKKFSFPLKPPPHSYFFFIITFILFLRKLFWGCMLGKVPWRRERLPTPVFWPGEFHGPQGHKELDMTERLSCWVLSFGTWTLSCNMKTLVPRARDQTPTPSPVSTHSFWAWYAPYRKKGGGEVERRARETAYL